VLVVVPKLLEEVIPRKFRSQKGDTWQNELGDTLGGGSESLSET
jgi:hypothetical protein